MRSSYDSSVGMHMFLFSMVGSNSAFIPILQIPAQLERLTSIKGRAFCFTGRA